MKTLTLHGISFDNNNSRYYFRSINDVQSWLDKHASCEGNYTTWDEIYSSMDGSVLDPIINKFYPCSNAKILYYYLKEADITLSQE